MAVYRKVGPRLKAHPRLKTIMGQERLDKFAGYIERNLGALAGNFLFGIMLGSNGNHWLYFGFTPRYSPYCLCFSKLHSRPDEY